MCADSPHTFKMRCHNNFRIDTNTDLRRSIIKILHEVHMNRVRYELLNLVTGLYLQELWSESEVWRLRTPTTTPVRIKMVWREDEKSDLFNRIQHLLVLACFL